MDWLVDADEGSDMIRRITLNQAKKNKVTDTFDNLIATNPLFSDIDNDKDRNELRKVL